jgi:hypothetical protein
MKGVIIKKGKVGQNVLGGEDSISAMVIFCTASISFPSALLNKATEIYNLADVTAQGITSAHGAIYRDIVEFYRMAGEGTKLWIYAIESTALGTDIEDNMTAIAGFINEAKGEIKQLGLTADAMDKSYGFTKVNGILAGVHTAIPLLQDLADECFEAGRPLQFILPAPNIDSVSSLEHWKDGDDDIYENISLVIATDKAAFTGVPLVGTLLGTVALASVNENIGKVEEFRIDNALKGKLVEPTIGLGIAAGSLTDAVLKTLTQKGYIFLINYTDYPGVYWNDDPTLAKELLDEDGNMNPASIQKGRTLNKALRLVRRHFIPKLKKNYKLTDTGKLPSAMVKLMEMDCEQAIDIMGNEISGRKVKINPNSNLLTGEKALEIEYIKIIPEGVVGVVKGNINLVNLI